MKGSLTQEDGLGARKLSQFQDNLACLDLRLDATQMDRLGKVSKIELGFSHDIYAREMVRTFVYADMRERIDA